MLINSEIYIRKMRKKEMYSWVIIVRIQNDIRGNAASKNYKIKLFHFFVGLRMGGGWWLLVGGNEQTITSVIL